MICEKCSKYHNGNYGSGRFCSEECARSFASKEKRLEINEKVSKTLKNRHEKKEIDVSNRKVHFFTKSEVIKGVLNRVKKRQEDIKNLYETNWTLLVEKYYKKTWKHFILIEQNNRCAICNEKNIWNGKPLVLQLDHIDGNNMNNERENLRMICPNCHSQTDTFTSKNIKKKEPKVVGSNPTLGTMEEQYFSEEQFKSIRKYIDDLFKDELYGVRKSSFEWSKQNDWRIVVNLSMNWRNKYHSAPEEKLKAVSDLILKVYEFVKNDEYNMRLVGVHSRSGFGFEFVFQPLVIVTMKLLSQ